MNHHLPRNGRSGTIAVAYLMASQGIGYREALSIARGFDPGFVETSSQHRILELYERLLKVVSRKLLSRTIEIGKLYKFGRGVGHASKVLELSIELVSELEKYGVLNMNADTERALYVAAALHYIGVATLRHDEPDDAHREHSYRLIVKHSEELDSSCNCSVAEKAAIIARLHGKSDPVPQEMNIKDRVAIGIIRVADGLDYMLTQSVERIKAVKGDEGLIIRVLCGRSRGECRENVYRADAKKALLEEVSGIRLSIDLS